MARAADKLTQGWGELGIDPSLIAVGRRETIRTTRTSDSSDVEEAHLERLRPLVGADEAEIVLGAPLGEGGTAIVSAANQASLDREVAVKRLRPDPRDDDKVGLVREGYVLGSLQHPNIVPVHMLGRDENDLPMLVLKRVEGCSWRDFVGGGEALEAPEGEVDPLEWNLQVVMSVCQALHYGHSRGVLHRDIKPENVMIGHFGEVYLMDWGIAASLERDGGYGLPPLAEVREIVGTLEYMAPEMALGDGRHMGVPTDVYLLGACLHELLTGEAPHEADTTEEMLMSAFSSEPHDYPDDVPPELGGICHKALALDPADRYQSADELRLALVEFLRHRHSRRLASEAHEKLKQLEEALSEAGDDRVAVYRLFGECRFGCREALRTWRDNRQARNARQRAIELMAGYEIEHRAPDAAAALLAELDEPATELEERLVALRAELARDAERRGKLEQLERDADVARGQGERRRLVTLICILVALCFGALDLLQRVALHRPGFGTFAALSGGYGAALLFATLRWRERLANRANRHFLVVVWLSMVAPALAVGVGWVAGYDFDVVVAFIALLFFVVGVAVALSVNVDLAPAAVPYALAFVVAGLWPALVYLAIAVAGLAAWALLVRGWRRQDARDADTATGER
jgi:serine/threonine-protein kinase